MIVAQVEADITHTPSSVVGIFANTLNNEATRKVFKIKGVYLAGKGVEYNNYYYDTLKEEHSESSITIVVPALLRSSLTEQRTIECIAYLSKRLQPIGSRVDLLLNVIEVLSQKESAYTQDELQAFEVLQKKAAIGYRDVDGFIRNKIIHEERVAITILIGKSAIIDGDIKHQLNATSVAYDIKFARINLSSQGSIIEALHAHQRDCDILAYSAPK